MTILEILEIIQTLLSIIGSSAVLSALLPPKLRKWIPAFTQLVDIVGANVGNAKNRHMG